MDNLKRQMIQNHIKTHSEVSEEDCAAISMLQVFLRANGKIHPNFAHGDKWPNIDGTFEFVPEPIVSRRPKQNFSVQIKGTNNYTEEANGVVKYSLKSLAFPAYIYDQVTLDPGILFIVLNPDKRGKERVFWKYMSTEFINSINYRQNSMTIAFNPDEEIENTEESVNNFCNKLIDIIDRHTFINQLDNTYYSKQDINKLIKACDADICESIDRLDVFNETRDDISKRMLRRLQDLCESTLLLNLINENSEKVNIKLAYERARLSIKTKYLASFYKGLRYLGRRIPDEGQSERLMLKYYDFLWRIRKYLKECHNISILNNLEKFPLNTDKLDNEYYELVAKIFDGALPKNVRLSSSRYYVQKKTPFFINGEQYFEVTLQLAGVYATKFNRITAYTKEDISTNYSIKIGYVDRTINLWGVDSKVKVIINWQVSIDSKCLNKLGKILKINTKLTSRHNEYESLMKVLSDTGLSFLDLIDLQDEEYSEIIKRIYCETNTQIFKEVLDLLKKNYNQKSTLLGRNTIRYIIMDLREDTLEKVLPFSSNVPLLCDELLLSRKCYPFERNPFLSNIVGKKSSAIGIKKLVDIAGEKTLNVSRPYLTIKNAINKTGEIYFETGTFVDEDDINNYNNSLSNWEKMNGFCINNESGLICISSYETRTLNILRELIKYSKKENKGQEVFNKNYLKNSRIVFEDSLKEQALKEMFVNSQLLLIYGAAGTGKTTLINHISNMMSSYKKLFLTKTHTALQNLIRRIENPGKEADFVSFDSFTKKLDLNDYDIIFIDECSTIDNRAMEIFFDKINPDTLLVLAGDIHQIESIDFGNWFYYAKDIIKTPGANVELLNTWRTEEEELKSLWHAVRCRDDLITEKLVIDGPFSENIGVNVLDRLGNDEVILCLNYDGKFGLNNMNNYFQNANKNEEISWQEWNYKIGDPILFNDNKRFTVLYNNLKGKIVDIEKSEDEIAFTIDVDLILTEKMCEKEDIEFIDIINEKGTRIKFKVYKYNSDDSEDDSEIMLRNSIIPFQLAYAVSIHKAQGLEYDSVKIIIPSNNSEKITHGIFYTAITRAKKKLKIFWSSETMNEIVKSFNLDNSKKKSLEQVKSKLGD